VPGATVAANCFYIPAASITVLIGSGLATDLIGPLVGISAPLRAAPLLVALELVCAGLLLAARDAPPETQIPWLALDRPVALTWPIILPLVAAAGALRLNSGHSNLFAELAIVLVIITLVATFVRAPWCDDALLIVIIFAAGPVLASLYLSFTEYNIVKPPHFVGPANYISLLTNDPQMRQSLLSTLYYAALTIPLSLLLSLLVALLLNQPVRGVALYRTLWYLPVLVPAVATGTLWRWALNTDFGLVNWPLKLLGNRLDNRLRRPSIQRLELDDRGAVVAADPEHRLARKFHG